MLPAKELDITASQVNPQHLVQILESIPPSLHPEITEGALELPALTSLLDSGWVGENGEWLAGGAGL